MADEATATEGQPEGGAKPAGDAPDRVAELSKEAASYRTQRNAALRRSHAYETMLKAHGVDLTPVTEDSLSGLPINAGRVDAPFEYKPPKIEVPKQVQASATPGAAPALTKEALRSMSVDEINKRWDEVSAVLRG